jgi:hypothetical protein
MDVVAVARARDTALQRRSTDHMWLAVLGRDALIRTAAGS